MRTGRADDIKAGRFVEAARRPWTPLHQSITPCPRCGDKITAGTEDDHLRFVGEDEWGALKYAPCREEGNGESTG